MKKNKSGIKKNIAGGSNMRRARQGAVVPMMKGGVVKMAGGGMGKSGVKKMARGGKHQLRKWEEVANSRRWVEVANSKNNLWLHQVQKTLS